MAEIGILGGGGETLRELARELHVELLAEAGVTAIGGKPVVEGEEGDFTGKRGGDFQVGVSQAGRRGGQEQVRPAVERVQGGPRWRSFCRG